MGFGVHGVRIGGLKSARDRQGLTRCGGEGKAKHKGRGDHGGFFELRKALICKAANLFSKSEDEGIAG
jgi:hypothetical protein